MGASELTRHVRRGLRERADPSKADPMRAYMKSEMPFLGVQAAGQRAACREAFKAHQLPDSEAWREAVLELWRAAEYREEGYAAIALSGHRPYRAFALRLDTLPIYEELIVDGAWWDFVESVAIHRLGPLLVEHPSRVRRALLSWSRSRDVWKCRAAILAQNALKEKTDPELLHACIEPSLGRPEFFLRRAIGWALRERARVAPDEVVEYVRAHGDRLSPLSRREALKHIA